MNVTQLALAAVLVSGIARAQVTPPAEIKDPKLRALQTKHLDQLTSAAAGIVSHKYPAKFYLTRELDLKGAALTAADPRSIEFSVFEKQTALLVRGNYAANYPVETPSRDRVNRTFLDVAVPILNAAMPILKDEPALDAIVIELSHHVRRMAGFTIDRFENTAFLLPRATAQRIAETGDPTEQLAALSTATVYIDGRVVPFVVSKEKPAPQITIAIVATPPPPAPTPSAPPANLQKTDSQPAVDKMFQELGAQAHFDPLAKPELTTFRGSTYLRLSLITTLPAADSGSQYRLAALAFDRHVSHLIRSVMPYFPGAPGFEGIAFRTTVNAGSNAPPDSIEFFFPLAELRRYERYDITGQQLINAGFVLINGERVGLDLQTAEAVKP